MRDLLKRSIWPTLFFALLFSALSAQSSLKSEKPSQKKSPSEKYNGARSKPSASFAVEVKVSSQNEVETVVEVVVKSQEFNKFNLVVHNLSNSKISEPLEEQSIDLSSQSATRLFHIAKEGQPLHLIFEAYELRNGRKIGATARIRSTDLNLTIQQTTEGEPKMPLPKGTKF